MAQPRFLAGSKRWQARYTVTTAGVSRQVSAGTFRTRREAQDAITTAQAKILAGTWVDPANRRLTVREWSQQWYELRNTKSRKVESYLRTINAGLGNVRLGELTPVEVQRWVNAEAARGMMPSSVHARFTLLKQVMAKAVDLDMLPKNPCRGVDLPTVRRTLPVALEVADLYALEAAIAERFSAMVHLAAWGGLRWGEVAALRWTDIDLEAGWVHVNQAFKVNGKIGLPKGDKTRVVPVGAETVEVLRRHRRDFGGSELLFTTQRGSRPLAYQNFRQGPWAQAVQACQFEVQPTFHDLRHAHATHCVRIGMDWQMLAERLGHHKPSFTVDRYGQPRADKHEVTVAMLDVLMARSVASP